MSWPDQIITWTAYALAGAGVVLMLWALLWDRARGRRRCGRCWYDMSGAPGQKCPECGREAKSERGLLRTRRRWKWAGAGCGLCIAAYAAWVAPEVRQRGWIAAVPNLALIYMCPEPKSVAHWMEAPFRDAPWMREMLMAKDPAWIEMRRRKRTGSLGLFYERLYLRRMARHDRSEVESMVISRSAWPVGEPIVVEVKPPWWGFGPDTTVLLLTPRTHGLEQVRVVLIGYQSSFTFLSRYVSFRHYVLGELPAGEHIVTFDVELRRLAGRGKGIPGDLVTIWTTDIDLTLTVHDVGVTDVVTFNQSDYSAPESRNHEP